MRALKPGSERATGESAARAAYCAPVARAAMRAPARPWCLRQYLSRLRHPCLAERHEAECTDERRRKAPSGVLQAAVGINELRPKRRDAGIGVEVGHEPI